jgi:hypothetical protein
MSKKTYRQDRETLELVEMFTEDYVPSNCDAALWGDRHYDGMKTAEGVDISSRTKHREYMKRHNLTTYDDFSGEFERRQRERDSYHAGEHGTVNRRDIEHVIEQLSR